jgi:hypothetical protein
MTNEQIERYFLTIEQAKEAVGAMGIVVTTRQMQRWAYERVLPFFRLGRHLYIEKHELSIQIWRLQLDAIRAHGRARERKANK